VFKVHKVRLQTFLVHKALKVHKVIRAHKDHKELKEM
jgi:hypothetical protein